MERNGGFIFIGFINIKAALHLRILQYVEAEIPLFTHRSQMIEAKDVDKFIDFIVVDVNFYQSDMHTVLLETHGPAWQARDFLVFLAQIEFIRAVCGFITMYHRVDGLHHGDRVFGLEDVTSHIDTGCALVDGLPAHLKRFAFR